MIAIVNSSAMTVGWSTTFLNPSLQVSSCSTTRAPARWSVVFVPSIRGTSRPSSRASSSSRDGTTRSISFASSASSADHDFAFLTASSATSAGRP